MEASSSGQPACRDCTGFYALVNYIPDPLGAFLNELRAELVPGCQLRSHVTLLPPRRLLSPPEVLVRELDERIPYIHSFNVTLGDIEVFESTGVIYLGLRSGQHELQEVHHSLSDGVFAFDEPFPFHPHITLAQEIPASRFQALLNHAHARWRTWSHERSFPILNLAFVRNATPVRWDCLSEYELQPARLRRTA
jgi:2'-5' RNA ligase